MKKIMLNGKWSAKCFTTDKEIDFTYEGNIPGCVHTDLMGTKIPEDIYYRDNADQCSWIEDRDFEYTKTFTLDFVPKGAKLVFEASAQTVSAKGGRRDLSR